MNDQIQILPDLHFILLLLFKTLIRFMSTLKNMNVMMEIHDQISLMDPFVSLLIIDFLKPLFPDIALYRHSLLLTAILIKIKKQIYFSFKISV